MKPQYILLLSLVLIVNGYCSSNRILVGNKDMVASTAAQNFETHFTTSGIDQSLKKSIFKEKNLDLTMSNPNQPYNITDTYVKNLPDKRLIIWGEGSDGINFLLYEERGSARPSCLLFKRLEGGKYLTLPLRINGPIKTTNELKNILKTGEYETL